MEIGLIGCGTWPRAGARLGSARARAPTRSPSARRRWREVGGEALGSNAEVAERADLVVLCHKPAQLGEVARELAPHAQGRSLDPRCHTARGAEATPIPTGPSTASSPRSPSEVRQGAIVQAADPPSVERRRDPDRSPVRELFAELGTLVVLDDALVDVAMGLMSCAPAYVALVAEAQVDAGVRRGIPAAQASELVVQTLAGTAELLRQRDYDTLAVRREVTSPGGLTARGLDALERAGLRRRFSDALDAVLGAQPAS